MTDYAISLTSSQASAAYCYVQDLTENEGENEQAQVLLYV
jgi:hypothetical protein